MYGIYILYIYIYIFIHTLMGSDVLFRDTGARGIEPATFRVPDSLPTS